MKKLIISAVATTGLLAAGYALADGGMSANNSPTTGNEPYVSASVGTNYVPDTVFSRSGVKADTDYSWGYNGLLAFGYRYNNWRADVSVGYLHNNVDSVKVSGAGANNTSHNANGYVQIVPYLLNGYYDINTTTNFVPYVGLGLGGAYVDLNSRIRTSGVNLKGTDNVFAYQGILGLAYQFTPNLRANLDYHYLATTSGTFKLSVSNNTSTNVSDNFQAHLINLGISYMFKG